MHAISHTLAHRAPPASRTRARWQPYSSLPYTTAAALSVSSSSGSKSSSPASNSTPATSVISPCQPTPAACDPLDRSALQNPALSASDCLRDTSASKNKFALGLVDQAVKTLCEVWRPQDIPPAFNSPRPTKQTTSLPNISSKSPLFELTSLQRLATPKSHPTAAPTASSSIPTTRSIPSAPSPALVQSGNTTELRHLVPLRGFVHEVLRRSRTSGCVLQTALCYLEAIRPKISELAHLEQIGKGTNGEPESYPRIIVATPEEIEQSRLEEEQELAFGEGPSTIRCNSDEEGDVDYMDTVRIEIDEGNCFYGPDEPSMNQQRSSSPSSMPMDSTSSHIEETVPPSIRPSTSSTPSPNADLPSPLLCPRRAFLAALILASKFTQDKCYSNRAWAKLSGLPPREIGRCERALGSALEWRLWVGKSACTDSFTASQPLSSANRAFMRCQSESSLNMTIASPSDPINRPPVAVCESSAFMPETAVIASATLTVPSGGTSGNRRMISRASTLPDGVLSWHFSKTGRNGMSQFISPTYSNSAIQSWDATSSTLVAPSSSFLPAVQLQVASPIAPTDSGMSTTSTSPSPDLPGLSYSPSSVSSSPSSSYDSAACDPTVQMSTYFEDASNPAEFYNSPVARINTKLLVPGYNGHNGSSNVPSFATFGKMIPSESLTATVPAGFDYPAFNTQQSTYGAFSISPPVTEDAIHGPSYQQVQ